MPVVEYLANIFFDGDPKLKVGISFIFHSVKYVKKKWRKRLY
ncbi:hypothetical protein HMPREF9553_00144 [Escherichia coli MS 200-1]|nr:hypothetical protein HMPREF9553_00144 [Escherichia coli MS 200-1]